MQYCGIWHYLFQPCRYAGVGRSEHLFSLIVGLATWSGCALGRASDIRDLQEHVYPSLDAVQSPLYCWRTFTSEAAEGQKVCRSVLFASIWLQSTLLGFILASATCQGSMSRLGVGGSVDSGRRH